MGYIDLKKINLDELVGVVTMYPWFGGAHVELCRRMSKMGGDAWGVAQYADAAMYVGAREKLSYLMSASQNHDWSDADVDQILKTYLPDNKQDSVESVPLEKRQVYVVGGESIYRELLPFCEEAYVTRIDYEYQADRYFPNLDQMEDWEMYEEGEEETFFSIEYYFNKYRRVK
jgi:dihydrofolate reductase